MGDAVRGFLLETEWADAKFAPIAGDLSARQYFRLSLDDSTAVLMDATAEPSSTPAFVRLTHWLRDAGLSAPAILKDGQKDGLLLLEDLGDQPVSRRLSDPRKMRPTLDVCLDLLLAIRALTTPKLFVPTPKDLCSWTTLADDYYPGAKNSELDAFRPKLETVLARHMTSRPTVSLRDFHADNLMWLPDRTGIARLGLLDYQDAMLTHPVYDLVSLLTDARTSISREVRAEYIRAYAERSHDDLSGLEEAFAAFSIQRNLRILGIFHRAAVQHGKHHHIPKVARVYGYLSEALEHPAFAEFRPRLSVALPPPEGLE